MHPSTKTEPRTTDADGATDEYARGTCAACGELPYGHDDFTCTGFGHDRALIEAAGMGDRW